MIRDKMVIVHVIQELSAGGAETFTANLCVQQARESWAVHLVLLAGVRDGRGRALVDLVKSHGVIVHGDYARKTLTLKNIFLLRSVIRRSNPSVVQATMFPAEVMVVLATLFLFWRGVLVRRLANSDLLLGRPAWALRIIDFWFTGVVACGDEVGSVYKRWTRCQKSLVVIRNGIDPPRLDGGRGPFLEKLRISGKGLIVLHIGRFDGARLADCQKGQDVLLKALAILIGEAEEVCGLFVGKGHLREEAIELVYKLRIQDRVAFVDTVANVGEVLAFADLFVLPSRFEGMPNSLIEAAVAGIPIIASDIPEIRSVDLFRSFLLFQKDNEVELACKIKQASSEIQKRKIDAVRDAGKFRLEFDMVSCAQRYARFYSELLE